MESMGSRMKRRRLRGLVRHHRSHPSAHPRRLVRRVRSWGERPVNSVCRWCGEHASSIQLTWHGYCLDAYRVASGQKPGGIQLTMCEAAPVPPTSLTTGLPSTSPGHWDRRPSGGRSHWRTCSGSATRATGARPGWTEGSRVSCRSAHWTGEEPGGPGDSTAPGPVCFSVRSG